MNTIHFETDEQSYNDLSVFAKNSDDFCLFDLFKHTKTVWGREVVRMMMKNPISSPEILIERAAAIEFLSTNEINLSIDHTQVDLILHYINCDKHYLKDNLIDATWVHLKAIFKTNEQLYTIEIGLKKLLALIEHSESLSENLLKSGSSLLFELGERLQTQTQKLGIAKNTKTSKAKGIGIYKLAKLDVIVRGKNRLTVVELLHVFYELDALRALANAKKTNGFCMPSYNTDEMRFETDELFHPAIENAVPNSLSIDKDENLLFFSGSNMAGKSSLLKSIGTAIYLAHLGFPVPAKRLETSVFDGLIVTVNLPDNVSNGLSHYVSEVNRIKEIAQKLAQKKKLFVILDELFKGTNAKDSFDASLLVIKGLAQIRTSIFIISSHITELAKEFNDKNIKLNYLEHQMRDGELKFTYKLKNGVNYEGVGMYFVNKAKIEETLKLAKE